jgi:choline dehydrogenase
MEGHGFTVNTTFLRPRSVGSVTLASADPNADPVIDPNYHDDPKDREMSLRLIGAMRENLSQNEMAKYIRAQRLPGPEARTDAEIIAYVRQYACCDYHPVGTCKMGSDSMAVVDSQLRVHGLEGLRVVDASIMPVLLSCNTNAPTMMIAEKAAAMIKNDGAPASAAPSALRLNSNPNAQEPSGELAR